MTGSHPGGGMGATPVIKKAKVPTMATKVRSGGIEKCPLISDRWIGRDMVEG